MENDSNTFVFIYVILVRVFLVINYSGKLITFIKDYLLFLLIIFVAVQAGSEKNTFNCFIFQAVPGTPWHWNREIGVGVECVRDPFSLFIANK